MCVAAISRRVTTIVLTQTWLFLLQGAMQESHIFNNPAFGRVECVDKFPFSGSGDYFSLSGSGDGSYFGSGDRRSDINILDDSEVDMEYDDDLPIPAIEGSGNYDLDNTPPPPLPPPPP
ncbi:uncharacterized protein LOC122243908, partial [Penaeus japonicus]|uniref:uncharacterized protein LOC122243908 n=1 Tax=Penaeus japonicus TaxID=27405 RepID=UPI001C7135D9